ncbi:MAG: carboxypeptidase regulatory-like domain-containing protein [Planctomycetota bacterium]|nr:carboxypeptidase regulatory-like domain-containing protein [Planctomycetota bacterium]
MARVFLANALLAGVAAVAWFVLGEGEPRLPTDLGAVDGPHVAEDGSAEGPALSGIAGAVNLSGQRGEFSIRGRVLTVDGASVSGTRVGVRRVGEAWNPSQPQSWVPDLEGAIAATIQRIRNAAQDRPPMVALTPVDGQGRFVTRLETEGKYAVQAVPPAPAVGFKTTVDLHAGKESVDVVLTVRSGAAVEGRVLSADGAPVAARVSATQSTMVDGAHRSWSDDGVESAPETGVFVLPAVPHGEVWFHVRRASDGARLAVSATISHEGPLVLRMPGGSATLSGVVSDAAEAPVAGALLAITVRVGDVEPRSSVTYQGMTDANGRYSLVDVTAGAITSVEAVARGFLPYTHRHPQDAQPQITAGTTTTHDVVLARGGVVRGRVTDSASGQSIAGATVLLYPTQGSNSGITWRTQPATTDAHGAYRIENVPAGAYVAVPTAREHHLPQVLPPGATTMMPAEGGGAPPARLCFVYAQTEDGSSQTGWVRVDAKGAFKLVGLRAVPYRLHLMRHAGLVAVNKPTPVTPPATGIEIRLPTTSSLSGRLEGVAGEEAALWRVRLHTADGTQVARVRLDDKGAWTAPAVPDADEVWVAAMPRQGDRYALAGPLRPAGQSITMQVKTGRGIAGRVENIDAGTAVWAVGAQGWQSYAAVTEDGSFRIPALPPGTYTVHARLQDGQMTELPGIQDGAEGVAIRVP